jgi:hypothetical protein
MEYTFNRLSKLAGLLKEDAQQDVEHLIKHVPDYSEFVNKLADLAKDPKVQKFIKSGQLDGNSTDDILKSTRKFISVKELRPTQNEIDVDKSLKYPLTVTKCLISYLDGGDVTVVDSIVTYNGKYIIDGHHRWSQLYAINPEARIDCFDLHGTDIDPISILKIVQLSIAGEIGTIPVSEVHGENLLKVDSKFLSTYIANTISKECTDIFVDRLNLDKTNAVDLISSTILRNVASMRKTSKPVTGAPERNVMPQTDQAPGVLRDLTRGEVNFSKPFSVDRKLENRQFLSKFSQTVLQESINKFSKIR